ncbi:MAG TPA: indolepyruvate ferredoxin oxidoreductase family protein [Mycobacteriales bacterium]|nr:indolepyruvate ferredoxin oxidoreductase family protein [Mycobacteriales bacterium]
MTALDDRPSAVDGPVEYALADRYRVGARPVLLTGVQAVARLLAEQHARDARAGRRTATFMSGYQGSPLGGLDQLVMGLPQLRTDSGVHLVPGMNEELAATAVWGSQTDLQGRKNVDGVVGVWYGKGPGVDRAGDALRHATTYGAHPAGGALVLAGDDPGAKSSTVPCASERTLAAMGMPVLFPRNAEEVITLGLYGVALSRASGCWVALKIVADVADGIWTVDRDFADVPITVPSLEWEGKPWTYQQRLMLSPPDSLVAEADVLGPRWAMVEAFGAANPVDAVEVDPDDAWLTLVAAGTAFEALTQALATLGIDRPALGAHGVRLLRVGMPYPLGADIVRSATRAVSEVLVVEEKVSFVESQVRDVLYGTANPPRVLGKKGRDGEPLVPPTGALTGGRLEAALRRVLDGRVPMRASAPKPRTQLSISPVLSSSVRRTPTFCSGCPHNRSTIVPEGSIAAGGIGCHTMVAMIGREASNINSLTQMGGEGAQWIGQAPFSDVAHIFQNIGDGTYFHSGQLAVQASVAAGTNITYKLLYNGAVAMTGAQDAQAALPVPALTRKLIAEGVRRVIVCADEPERYDGETGFAAGVVVWHRDRLDEAQRLLRDVPGTTVLIYDQQCAAEARRKRKRGLQPARTKLVLINEDVCEGCGDCGVKSSCLSVQPVETELGRKTRIDQTSCNTDYSCLAGDCPSFVTVEVDRTAAKAAKRGRPTPPAVAEPTLPVVHGTFDLFLAGIGGTGIVTVNQVLATAALRSGLRAVGLDQTGLSQKAGPVTSHLRISAPGVLVANRVGAGTAHTYLAFDAVVGADPANVAQVRPGVTTVVASTSETPTGTQVREVRAAKTDTPILIAALTQTAGRIATFDALAASDQLLGSTAAANLLLVGAAYQLGALPFTAETIEWAITLNGVAVDANIAAFRWGRVAVADPAAFHVASNPAPATTRIRGSVRVARDLLEASPLTGETRRLTEHRAALLVDYQGKKLARSYVDLVEQVWTAERALGDRTELSEAVARSLHHVAAYKDEYEVARLLTAPEAAAAIQAQVPGATHVTWNLHPPALRAMGRKDKLHFGPASRPVLAALAKGKRLRGTAFDPFGRAHLRVVERALRDEHWDEVARAAAALTGDTYDKAVARAQAILDVRGYEGVKLASIDRYRATIGGL